MLSVVLCTVGVSVFVSIFVSKKIEAHLAAEKQAELENIREAINVDVFDSLFKRLIPAEIFTVFKSDVIGQQIIRKAGSWIYDFKEIPHSNGRIELIQTVKHELHNIGHHSVDDAVSAVFDGHRGSGLIKAVCTEGNGVVANFDETDLEGVDIQGEYEYVSPDGKIKIVRDENGYTTIKIGVTIPSGGKVTVTQVYRNIYDNYSVNDGYFTKYSMIDASLTATFPRGYEFDIFQSMSSVLTRTLEAEDRVMYELKGGILPHQGFIYILKKKG